MLLVDTERCPQQPLDKAASCVLTDRSLPHERASWQQCACCDEWIQETNLEVCLRIRTARLNILSAKHACRLCTVRVTLKSSCLQQQPLRVPILRVTMHDPYLNRLFPPNPSHTAQATSAHTASLDCANLAAFVVRAVISLVIGVSGPLIANLTLFCLVHNMQTLGQPCQQHCSSSPRLDL